MQYSALFSIYGPWGPRKLGDRMRNSRFGFNSPKHNVQYAFFIEKKWKFRLNRKYTLIFHIILAYDVYMLTSPIRGMYKKGFMIRITVCDTQTSL